MNSELVFGLHTFLVVGTFVMTVTVHPDLQRSIALPITRLRVWYQQLREAFRSPRPGGPAKRFWEIDMTEFEP